MQTRHHCCAFVASIIAVSGLLFPLSGADPKPDRKKSAVAYERGRRADQAGKRSDALAAYSEALEADPSNTAAMRARGRDYLLAGETAKAAADLERAVKS